MASRHKPGAVTRFILGFEFKAETKTSQSYGRYIDVTIVRPRAACPDAEFRRAMFELRDHARRRFAKAVMVEVPESMLNVFVGAGFTRPTGWEKHVLVI